ncbi:MAG: matrixin family metalloprotease [Gemmatimonadota bacterium]
MIDWSPARARPLVTLFGLCALAVATFGTAAARRPPDAQVTRRLDASRPITYFIAEGAPESGFRASDRALALLALEAWGRLADPPLRFEQASEEAATVRVYWVTAGTGLYGEMRARTVDSRPAADIFVHPDTDGLGSDIAERARVDPLFRDTVVYLTCVHELGHAFGLPHTSAFADIMYSFQYGGDFVGYFMRFRDRLRSRADFSEAPPFSAADARAFDALYGDVTVR